MPYKPKKPCSYPGCNKLVDGDYCDEHKKLMNKNYNKYTRDKTAQKFYNSKAWKEVRKKKLMYNPLCEECIKKGNLITATVVDYIIPISQGGSKLEFRNLQSLCSSCHNKKSIIEGSRFGKRV